MGGPREEGYDGLQKDFGSVENFAISSANN
jgi:hypothetical protein